MTSEQIRYARGLAEAHAPKSTDPMCETTEARSTIELLPRLTLRLLDEREALLEAAIKAILTWRTSTDADANAKAALGDAIALAEGEA